MKYNLHDRDFINVAKKLNCDLGDYIQDETYTHYSQFKVTYDNNKNLSFTHLNNNKTFCDYDISEQILYDLDDYDYITVIDQLEWQKQGLMYTATGYGSKIPTSYKIFKNNRFYRVYAMRYGNLGTLYILINNEKFILRG